MKLNITKVRELIIQSPVVENPDVSFLAEGFGNYNYLVEENGEKLVFRIKKNNETQFDDSLEREYVFLKFFENQGIKFCPKVIYYNKEFNYLIEKFIEGKKVFQKDFSKRQIDILAKQLYQLFSLNIDDFFDFCSNNNLIKFHYKSPIQSLKQYGFNRFEEAKKGDVDSEVISWIKERLEKNLKYLQSLEDSGKFGFSWGDIQSSVIIDNSGQINFYDFEHVIIAKSPGLTYIKIHGKFNDTQFDYLVERYSYYSKESKKSILKGIINSERIIRVNDVVWAATKWAKTKEDKFKQLTYKRIKLADKLKVIPN